MEKILTSKIRWLRFPAYAALLLAFFVLWPRTADDLQAIALDVLHEINTQQDLQEIALALQKHHRETGTFPAPEEMDRWLKQVFAGQPQYHLPIDRWGNALHYETTEDRLGFSLRSSGRDGIPGTSDDLGRIFFFPSLGDKAKNDADLPHEAILPPAQALP
ncbi:type II secretion system (T2SS) protein G [Desulfobotulus alkaliphilus]|uniref:Type II secretion system (T2SS) protein G n=1 Tax=Desulfobotulus alkaliphilus TaxID=622671 RepID=A0A562RCW3_9BACT|nr:type II secretion system protein GspG [Desulfobotulus alkaliphilus]TWI66899.1 type II secretion system (T2SS) protein G [Desulfobotulus alkaliphilus]